MSDVLKILGLVANKVRSATVSYLSDGDLTDERFRKAIMSDIDDMKASLRGLARERLEGSLSFLKEGISRMGLAVRHKSASTQKVETAMTQAVEEFVAGASASKSQQTKHRSANEALSLSDFEIVSQERWVSAKESFDKCREQATIAFGNTALSIEDRIVACKLRIASSILKKFLDDPEAGAQDCLLYLQELHDLPAIRQMFTVQLYGGFKSFFNTTKRSEIVESITAINEILFDFILNFTEMIASSRSCTDLNFEVTIFSPSFKWPVVQLTNSQRNEHIFLSENGIQKKSRENVQRKVKQNKIKVEENKNKVEENRIKPIKKRWPNFKLSSDTENGINYNYFDQPQTVNSAGRIYWRKSTQFVDERSYVEVESVDIAPNDILYTLESRLTITRVERLKYFRINVCGRCTKFPCKGLPPAKSNTSWVMRVLENKIVLCNSLGEVFILKFSDTQDQLNLESSFSLPSPSREEEFYMCVTNKHEVIIARSRDKEVYICPITEEGQVEGVIRVPLEKHETESKVRGVAFDATHEEDIIVLRIRYTPHQDSHYQIEVYSRNGDTRGLYPLPECWSVKPSKYNLLSNPKGIVAVVGDARSEITFWNLVGNVFVRP